MRLLNPDFQRLEHQKIVDGQHDRICAKSITTDYYRSHAPRQTSVWADRVNRSVPIKFQDGHESRIVWSANAAAIVPPELSKPVGRALRHPVEQQHRAPRHLFAPAMRELRRRWHGGLMRRAAESFRYRMRVRYVRESRSVEPSPSISSPSPPGSGDISRTRSMLTTMRR